MSKLVLFDSLEFLLNVTETYSTNVTFTFGVVFGLGINLVCTFFLTLKFDVIFELFVLEDNGYQLGIFFVWESVISKSCRLKRKTHLSSPLLLIVCAGKLRNRKSWLIISGFTHCGSFAVVNCERNWIKVRDDLLVDKDENPNNLMLGQYVTRGDK